MLQKLFANGKSWRSTIAGVVVLVGGLPLVLASAGVLVPAWLSAVGGVCALIGTTFGFSQTKDKQVTGVPNAANTQDIAVTPTTADPVAKP